MKKLAILAALAVMSLSAMAQKATVALNNFDSNVPILLAGGAQAGASDNVYVQLLNGTTPVTDTTGKLSVFPVNAAPGFFDAGIGIVPGATPGGTANLTLNVWQGTAASPGDYATATSKATVTLTGQKLGNWNDAASPPPPPTGESLVIPGPNITLGGGVPPVPEPSTIALGVLGAAALLIRRRK